MYTNFKASPIRVGRHIACTKPLQKRVFVAHWRITVIQSGIYGLHVLRDACFRCLNRAWNHTVPLRECWWKIRAALFLTCTIGSVALWKEGQPHTLTRGWPDFETSGWCFDSTWASGCLVLTLAKLASYWWCL